MELPIANITLFFRIWSINSCLFIEPFCVNACKHDLHLYAFSPLCTFLCDFNRFSPLNIRGHWSHFRVFSRCETLWPFRLTSVLNALPHRSHLNFFTLECKALCLCNVPWLAYFFGHSLHLKGLSSASNFFLSTLGVLSFFVLSLSVHVESGWCVSCCFPSYGLITTDKSLFNVYFPNFPFFLFANFDSEWWEFVVTKSHRIYYWYIPIMVGFCNGGNLPEGHRHHYHHRHH